MSVKPRETHPLTPRVIELRDLAHACRGAQAHAARLLGCTHPHIYHALTGRRAMSSRVENALVAAIEAQGKLNELAKARRAQGVPRASGPSAAVSAPRLREIRVRLYRVEKREAARRLGCDDSYIHHILTGRRPMTRKVEDVLQALIRERAREILKHEWRGPR